MSVHVNDVLMGGNLETLNNTKEKIKKKFNIQEYRKVKNVLGVYYEWDRDAKGTYAKIIMGKDVKKLVEVYKKYTGIEIKVYKNPGAPGTTLSKSDLEESYNIDN